MGLPSGEPMVSFGVSTSALPVPSGLSRVRWTAVTLCGFPSRPGSGLIDNGERCDQREVMLGLERRQESECWRQWASVTARFAQISLGDAADNRLAPRPEPASLRGKAERD